MQGLSPRVEYCVGHAQTHHAMQAARLGKDQAGRFLYG